MATCGYLCPSCEGKEFMEDGSPCTWCKPLAPVKLQKPPISDEEWAQLITFFFRGNEMVLEYLNKQ